MTLLNRTLLPVVLALLLAGCSKGGSLQQASVELLVDLPLAQSWEKLQDFSVPHHYVPGLTRTEIVSGQSTGWGAHRKVYNEDGGYLEETILDWEEGRGFTLDLHRGEEPMQPFKFAQFAYRLDAATDDRTRVTLSLRFEMPMGTLGATLGDWFVKPRMQEELVQIGAGLKHYYETGTAATDEDRARLVPAVTPLE